MYLHVYTLNGHKIIQQHCPAKPKFVMAKLTTKLSVLGYGIDIKVLILSKRVLNPVANARQFLTFWLAIFA